MLRMTVLYPQAEDTTFDWDYYTEKHMGLIAERWGDHMAREPEVTKGLSAVPKGDPSFVCISTIYFADQESLNAALKAGGMDVPNDIPNFTNVQPIMQLDEVVG